eukprot:TRINITY_DN2757_c0_g2_i1.p1 TRINITY_DN2757_c0_g2~~TRINITY_DN2757_c0_g2_i1.p1  ORF type:complete len:468 (+),score=155.52 TRINITY_DN2757_c0_g2_i1:91-1494(+)
MISTLRRSMLRAPRLGQRGVGSQVLADPMAWNQAPAVVTTLPNGLRVATKESFSPTTSVGVFVDAGVRDETKATAGAATLINKLALTGTAKKPKAQFEKELELMGAELAVNMGREKSSFMVNGGDISQAVAMLGDVVKSPGVSNFAKEKEAIFRSIEDAEQPTRSVIEDRLHSCAFRDCSLGFSTIGPFENSASLTQASLDSFVATNFTADRMVLAASGPVKHEELVKLAAASLGDIKTGAPAAGVEKPYFCGAELIYRNDEMGPLAFVSVGFEGVPLKSPDALAFMVMQYIIGSYKKDAGLVPGKISGNRVINNVANKMGIGCAEEFAALNYSYRDTGLFGFYAMCDEVAVEHCLGELMFGINLLSFSVTDEEVARGKRELKNALFGRAETSAEACAELGTHVLAYGRSIPVAEMMLRIDAIDAEEIKRVAWDRLNDNEIAVTALGPLHGMPQYMELRRATNMHRY